MASVTVRDVLAALQTITRGRMVASPEEAYRGGHPYAVWKSSGIPGKEVLEIPGLVTASISRISGHHPLAGACRERGINLLAGNSHALEIWENGLPLAYALQALLPGVEVLVFRERLRPTPWKWPAQRPCASTRGKWLTASCFLPQIMIEEGLTGHVGSSGSAHRGKYRARVDRPLQGG